MITDNIGRGLARLEQLGMVSPQGAVTRWFEEISSRVGQPILHWKETTRCIGAECYRACRPVPCPFGSGVLDFGGPNGFFLMIAQDGRFLLYWDNGPLSDRGQRTEWSADSFYWWEWDLDRWLGFCAGIRQGGPLERA